MGPMSVDHEFKDIFSLVADMIKNLCLDVDPLLDLSRDAERDASSPSLLFLGRGHTRQITEQAAETDPLALSTTRSSWRAGKNGAEGVVNELAEHGPCDLQHLHI
jgi:hypothetical protein